MFFDFVSSLRLTFRHLRKSPGFTVIAILSLTLGIGANTAIFSLINAVLLRPSALERPEELVEIYRHQENFSAGPLPYPDIEDLRAASQDVFEGVAASALSFTQFDKVDSVETVPIELISGNYFEILGIDAEIGRMLTPSDEVSRASVVVLDHAHWLEQHAGDPEIVGRQIRVSGQPFIVIGVAPSEYTGNLRGIRPAMYIPIVLTHMLDPFEGTPKIEMRDSSWVFAKARMLPGVSLVETNALLEAVSSSLREAGYESWQGKDYLFAMPTRDVIMNPAVDRFLFPASTLLLAVVALVLLVACTNLASFLLARAASRRKDVAVRLALGATRGSLIRQLLTETVLLSLISGALGIALAIALLHWLVNAHLPLPVPVTLDLSLDSRVLSFTLAVSLLAGVLFGLFPALQSSRSDVITTLKDEGTGGGRKRRFNMRSVLVTTQVAVSTLLLVGAGLFVRRLLATQNLDPGFGQQPTGMLNIFLPSTEYSEEQALRFYQRLGDRLAEIPGVTAVGLIDNPNLTPTNQMSRGIQIDGVEPPEGRDSHAIDFAHIDENYFETAGVPILEGRAFGRRDNGESPPVAIVSEAFVRRFFPDRDPIGARVRLSPAKAGDATDFEIVGIARDTKVLSLVEPPRPFLYLPIRQDFTPIAVFLATGPGDARQTAIAMLQAARELDSDVRVLESKTMARHISTFLLPAQASALFVGGFSLLALLLAMIGLYGLVSYSVAQRAREVGIRMAIGARPLEIIKLLMQGGLWLVFLGGVIGVALAALLSRGLSSLLYGVPAADPVTFLLVPLVLFAVAAVATLVPAWRASRIDPTRAMRID